MKLQFTDVHGTETFYNLEYVTRATVPSKTTPVNYVGEPEDLRKEFGVDPAKPYRDVYTIEVLVGSEVFKHHVSEAGRESILDQITEAEIT